jgi:hypothetical protein
MVRLYEIAAYIGSDCVDGRSNHGAWRYEKQFHATLPQIGKGAATAAVPGALCGPNSNIGDSGRYNVKIQGIVRLPEPISPKRVRGVRLIRP